MKTIIAILTALTLWVITGYIIGYRSQVAWETGYLQYWVQADRSSTIEAKSENVDKFIAALESGNSRQQFAEFNAIFLKKTAPNSFASNMVALKSLGERLHEIRHMDAKSFEYNTAIQQITQQEQGEASEMIKVFQGCYDLSQWPITWGWIGNILIVCLSGVCIVGWFAFVAIILG